MSHVVIDDLERDDIYRRFGEGDPLPTLWSDVHGARPSDQTLTVGETTTSLAELEPGNKVSRVAEVLSEATS